MGNSTADARVITLDLVREEARRRNPDLVVDGVVFRNGLRIPREERKKFVSVLKRDDDDGDADIASVLYEALLIVAADAEEAEVLLEDVKDDASFMTSLFSMYQDETALGEA